MLLCHLKIFLKNQLFKKILKGYYSVKQFGFRSGPTLLFLKFSLGYKALKLHIGGLHWGAICMN